MYLCTINNLKYIDMENKKVKKTFLLNTNEELFNRFRKLCEDEGFNTTVVLNYMMKSAVDKQVLW